MNEQTIEEIVRKHLKEHFPLYEKKHEVNVHLNEKEIFIGYRTNSHWNPIRTTHFDLHIIKDVCYVLWIEIIKNQRNKGYGLSLFNTFEKIAKKCDCTKMQMTFSGITHDGKPKIENIHKLGYTKIKNLEAEKFI